MQLDRKHRDHPLQHPGPHGHAQTIISLPPLMPSGVASTIDAELVDRYAAGLQAPDVAAPPASAASLLQMAQSCFLAATELAEAGHNLIALGVVVSTGVDATLRCHLLQ